MSRTTYEPIDLPTPPPSRRIPLAFWCLGLLNNASYVIMLASAKDISEGGTALVFIANVVPSLAIKLSAPYFFDKVSYHARILVAAALMGTSFLVVASFHTVTLQLVGVALASAQCGLGEASLLALAGLCDSQRSSKHCITCFSSGTGLAGVFGFLWKCVWDDWLGFSLRQTLWMASILVMIYIMVYVKNLWDVDDILMKPPREEILELVEEDGIMMDDNVVEDDGLKVSSDSSSDDEQEESSVQRVEEMNSSERFRLVLSLYPYMVPLFLVYAAEYVLQSGAWSAIGFPVTSMRARDEFFEYSNWMVCCEVVDFVSVENDARLTICCICHHSRLTASPPPPQIVSSRSVLVTIFGNIIHCSLGYIMAHAHFAVHQCHFLLGSGGATCLLQLLVVGSMFLCWIAGRCSLCQWISSNMRRFAGRTSRVFPQCHKCCRRNWNIACRFDWALYTIMSLSTKWTRGCSCVVSIIMMLCTKSKQRCACCNTKVHKDFVRPCNSSSFARLQKMWQY